ncbi:MAG: hypothetical protein WAV05_15575 [Anaerolineales bacterium]
MRTLCQQHGAHFQPIDLRCGVSEEALLDQQAMAICLGEIRRCQHLTGLARGGVADGIERDGFRAG